MPTKYKVLSEEKTDSDQIVTDDVKTPKAEERFPLKELIVMYLITASDSVALTVISPFVPGISSIMNPNQPYRLMSISFWDFRRICWSRCWTFDRWIFTRGICLVFFYRVILIFSQFTFKPSIRSLRS